MPSPRTIVRIARTLRPRIGAHVPMIGQQVDHDTYHRAESDSMQAMSLARYLCQHWARADAVLLVRALRLAPRHVDMWRAL